LITASLHLKHTDRSHSEIQWNRSRRVASAHLQIYSTTYMHDMSMTAIDWYAMKHQNTAGSSVVRNLWICRY